MLFMSNTSTAPRPAFAIASRVRLSRYSWRRRKSTRSSQSTCMRPGAGSEAVGNSALGMIRLLFEPVGHLAVLRLELQIGAPGFHLKQRGKIRVAQLEADHVGDDLMHERRHRHRYVQLAGGVEPQL